MSEWEDVTIAELEEIIMDLEAEKSSVELKLTVAKVLLKRKLEQQSKK